jgi:MSHA biogenesis protein MshJ
MNPLWQKMNAKLDAMSLRERVLTFFALLVLLMAITYLLLISPLLGKQKKMAAQIVQQQKQMQDMQTQLSALGKAKIDDPSSPLRQRLQQSKQKLADAEELLRGQSKHLVEPEKMVSLLEQVLRKNERLHLVNLQTLSVTPLVNKSAVMAGGESAVNAANPDKQVFKHGVQITLRGSYADLLQYLSVLEKAPVQMFWGEVQMKVVQHPTVELTLTLYTLSLDKTWLQV